MEDPITLALRPPARETPAERSARLAREAEAKKVSDEIDKRLREDANRRKKEKQGEVRILLLGQAGAGKTTIFKQMRLLYEPKAHEANRRWWREIVHLNVITALRGLLECLERLEAAAEPESQNSAMTAASGAERAISPSPSIMATAAEKRALLDRLKLAPILSLEQGLRQRLGAIGEEQEVGSMSGRSPSPWSNLSEPASPTSRSPQHPILLRAGWQDRIMEKLGWLSSEGTESDAESVAESTRSSSGRADLIGSLRRKRSSPVLGQIDASAGGGSSAEGRTAEYQRIYTRRRMKRESAEQMLIALKEDVLQLWHSPSAKKLRKRGKLESSDSDIYFLNNYERIAQRGYEPTDEDILYARVRTVGISDERIRIDKATTYHLYDVGGSRSQRNAWASYFDDANAIIFLAPVSAFDQTLLEDPSVNRVADSLLLFEEIAANPLLRDVSLILFLNKIDILERKLLRGVKVADHFPDFDGENELEDVWRYFRKEFRLRVTSSRSVAPQRPIYVHTTIATSTRQIKAILNSVNDTILRENLRITGLAL
ncbi:uncharacterized protein PFL1_05349 [Pseudozyma flocculosa PF-1]|uniref:G-protein alpha subunit n=1 Tax=Pseudozyma flocculosa PF-1 TaxID=1277687 RepID=A0A061H519_9BASI|nr:uncharacterized protein PFL1_05349 [Pseudozyma flocculosa PF-1]EPQ27065.1 hypothetical protein PFL1_05349 [Pseudozyma flocculosa PF-1]